MTRVLIVSEARGGSGGMNEAVASALKGVNHEIVEANTAREGLLLFNKTQFDVVITSLKALDEMSSIRAKLTHAHIFGEKGNRWALFNLGGIMVRAQGQNTDIGDAVAQIYAKKPGIGRAGILSTRTHLPASAAPQKKQIKEKTRAVA